MAYFLGRDVKVCVTTETPTSGVVVTGGVATSTTDGSLTAGADNEIPDLDVSAPLVSNSMNDVTGIDIGLGATDEDVAYLGQRTALKAEIKKESTISITRKKSSALFADMWSRGYRYGMTDGTTDPGTFITPATLKQPASASGYGYRVHVMLKTAKEVMTFAACTMSSYSTTLNPDGITEETMEFVTHVSPYVDGNATDGDVAATGSAPWNAEPYLF